MGYPEMYGYLVSGATVSDWECSMEEEKERGMPRVKGYTVLRWETNQCCAETH